MKNSILRILIGAALFTLAASIVVVIIGLLAGWTTSTQFSNGIFWAGIILIAIGYINYQGYRQRSGDELLPVHKEPADRSTALWTRDTLRGGNLMAVLGIAGALLIGLSILVGRLF